MNMESEFNFITFGDCLLEKNFIQNSNIEYFINEFNKYDFITFNLETVVSNLQGVKRSKSFNFKTELDNLKKFSAKIKIPIVCNIANNHILDYGNNCFDDTITNLKKLKINYTGVSENLNLKEGVTFIKIKNKMISFIGAFNGDNVTQTKKGLTILNNTLLNKVSYAKKNSDVVIVHLHWGQELSLSQTPEQVKFAHQLVEYGANIILGHHPHVMQGIEHYKNSLIIYSLGNFQIKCNKETTNQNYSHMIKVKINQNKKISYETIPIFIKNKIPKIIEINDIKNTEKYNKILRINQMYLKKNNWIYFFCESCEPFFHDSFASWKIRKKKKEKFLYLKFARWLISKNTVKMFFMNGVNKAFKIKEKIYEECK